MSYEEGYRPLFPFRYEKWARKRDGKVCSVVNYLPDEDDVEYMYPDINLVYIVKKDTFMKKFKFVSAP